MARAIEMRRGPAEQPAAIGIDEALERRPGVPMEAEPRLDSGAHWRTPQRQRRRATQLRRKGLARLTPVFGTAVPPRGISGLMRRIAYLTPEHRARHWLLLRAADRVDVLEGRLGRTLARPFRDTRLAFVGRQLERNPVRTVVVGGVVAGWVVRRVVR